MRLPFTREQFFDLFANYNTALWPVVLALWIVSLFICLRLLLTRRPADRAVNLLLAAHWAWAGIAYHAVFFTRINPAAWLFAVLFLIQAGLFVWQGVVHARLRLAATGASSSPLAWVLIAYALLYPAINAAEHLTLTRIPTFGVPCPTTILTAGLLMLGGPPAWPAAVIPVIWSVIGGSAAFLLGVHADYALPVAGIALAMHSYSSWKLGAGSS